MTKFMKFFKLDKVVLSFKNNAAPFLNGLTSNSLDKPQNAFLNIHGRIIATFEQLKINEDEVLVIVEKIFLPDVFSHLDRYAKLGGVKIEQPSDNVYFDLEGNAPPQEGDRVIPHKRGRLLITKRILESNVSEEDFTLFRVKNNIPLQGVDFKDEMLLNINEVDFVSFTKGCFLGQEPISKVHSRSKPTWQLMAKYEDECNAEEKQKMTSKTLDPEMRRVLGFVFVSNR